MYRSRPPILTPALEGSRAIAPSTPFARGPPPTPYAWGPRAFDPGPGQMLPPIGGPAMIMPSERISVPSLLRRPPTGRYLGPPSLLPMWGGYSFGGSYVPGEEKGKSKTERQYVPRPLPQVVERQQYVAPPVPLPPHPQVVERQQYVAPPLIPPSPKVVQNSPHYRYSFPGQGAPWDRYMGPEGRPPPLEYYQYREGQHPRKGVRKKSKHPFPGPKALRRFRHLGFAAWFIEKLKTNAKKNLSNRPSSVFLFGIILKEIVAALHRIYLNPAGNIYPVLSDIIGPNCYDLCTLVRGGQMGIREEAVLIQEMQYVIENLVYHITEIMPSTGVLGTHRRSAVCELIRSGKRFPDGYFWHVEMERLQFNENGRMVNVGDAEGFLLMLGIFISRSLVTTILMKPVDYGLSAQPLTDVAERNLRIVATALLYLVRRIAVSRNRGIMGMPTELAKYLYSDEEMTNVYSKLSRTFNYCEGLLREWGTEYIRRLRASFAARN